MEEAEAILKANPNVSPITLDMGANDILQFLEHHCGFPSTYTCTEAEVATELFKVAGNVSTIMEKLHALAPHATIVVVGQYNPYPLLLPKPGGDTSALAYNNAYVNPLTRFNPSAGTAKPESEDLPTICAYTAMCPGGVFNPLRPEADIHPTTLGYAVLAESISSLFGPTGPQGTTGATGPEGPQGRRDSKAHRDSKAPPVQPEPVDRPEQPERQAHPERRESPEPPERRAQPERPERRAQPERPEPKAQPERPEARVQPVRPGAD